MLLAVTSMRSRWAVSPEPAIRITLSAVIGDLRIAAVTEQYAEPAANAVEQYFPAGVPVSTIPG
jgi:hypothetical protein